MNKSRNSAWNYIKNYRWQSEFFHYFLLILITISIPLCLLSFTIIHYYSNEIKNEISNSAMQSLTKDSNSIDNIFSNIEVNYNIITTSTLVSSCLTQSNPNLDIMASQNNKTKVLELIKTYLTSNDYIHSVSIYNINSGEVYSTYDGGYYKNINDKSAFEIYEKTKNGNYVIARTATLSYSQSYDFITYCREIRFGSGLDGLLIVNINANKLDKTTSISNSNGGELLLVDNNNSVLYSSNISKFGKNISSDAVLLEAYKNSTRNGYIKNIYNSYLVASIALENHSWVMIRTISLSAYANKMASIQKLGILTGSIAIIFSMIFAFLISMNFYKSFVEIITFLQNPNEPPIKNEKKGNKNEMFLITGSILNILDNNSKIQQELSKRLSMLRKSQTIALQAQINPHFLFNTLQLANLITISTLKGDNDVTRIISLLSDLLRISFETKDNLTTVKSEIEYVQKYLEIQNIRYKNRFQPTWLVSEDTLDCKTIKLVLQPLIENAISHGINPMESTGSIAVSAKTVKNTLVLSVSDNGVGMSDDRLKEVLEMMKSEDIREDDNIGLCNVNQRIKLIFGDEYGAFIESSSTGTTVTLKMPIIKDIPDSK